jgi:hypothetical protein
MQSAVLTRHASTPAPAVRRVEASVDWVQSGVLALTFSLDGDIARLRVPAARMPRFVECLWEHTCFEAFVAADVTPAYHEFNFAPSGEWAAYAFRRYRDGAPLTDEALAPQIAMGRTDNRIQLDAVVPLHQLALIRQRAALRLALAAIIEQNDGTLSYWSLYHPPGKPDFHHADAFALRLEPPPGAW